MWKYLMLHDTDLLPEGCIGWIRYGEQRIEDGVKAYGEYFFDKPLTWEDIDRYDLHPCGFQRNIPYLDVFIG